jgi:hypothetical protein
VLAYDPRGADVNEDGKRFRTSQLAEEAAIRLARIEQQREPVDLLHASVSSGFSALSRR